MVRTKTARALAALAIGFLALGLTGPMAAAADKRPPPTPEERAAALIRPAVVYVEVHWSGFVIDEDGVVYNDGKPYEYAIRCTGFIVNPSGSIVTAGHCVDDTSAPTSGARRDFISIAVDEAIRKGTYKNNPSAATLFEFGLANWKVEGQAKDTPPEREVFVQRGVAAANQKGGDTLPARVVDFRNFNQGDVALLKIEKSDLPASLVAPASDIEIGTRVLSVGYPGSTDEVTDTSLEPTNKDGSVNAKKTVGSIPFYEISAAMSGGMSGGPTVDLQGRIVGVNSFSPQGETEAFNFIAPGSIVTELLTKNGVKNELGRTDSIYRAGLTEYFNGKYSNSIKQFDKVLALDPSHQQAQEYRQKAAKAKADGLEGGSSLPIIPIAIVVGLIGAGLVAFVAMRSRGGKTEPAMAGAPGASSTWASMPAATSPAAPQPAPEAPTSPPAEPTVSTPEPAPSTPVGFTGTPASPPPTITPPPAATPAEPPAVSPISEPEPLAPAASGSADAEEQVAFCPSCGTHRADGAAFCAKCGHRF